MANGNGKVQLAILSTDLKYVRQSQALLEKAVIAGFKENKEEFKTIKGLQQSNQNDILSAKASIRTLKTIFYVLGVIACMALTAWAAL